MDGGRDQTEGLNVKENQEEGEKEERESEEDSGGRVGEAQGEAQLKRRGERQGAVLGVPAAQRQQRGGRGAAPLPGSGVRSREAGASADQPPGGSSSSLAGTQGGGGGATGAWGARGVRGVRETVWGQSELQQTYGALQRDVRVDVVVVGGGINGLTAAYALRERGMSVVVLEAGVIGERREGEKEGGMDGGWQEVEGGSLSAGTGR